MTGRRFRQVIVSLCCDARNEPRSRQTDPYRRPAATHGADGSALNSCEATTFVSTIDTRSRPAEHLATLAESSSDGGGHGMVVVELVALHAGATSLSGDHRPPAQTLDDCVESQYCEETRI